MSLTIDTQPSKEITPAYIDNIWKLTSDRDDSASETVLGWSDNGSGFVRYLFTSHSFKVGDIVIGAGHTTQPTYNVRQAVTFVSATQIDTDVLFLGGSSGAPTITRDNTNFKVLADLVEIIGPAKSISGFADQGGGIVRVTLTGAQAHVVGDFVFIDTTSSYDGTHKITNVVSDTVYDIEVVFVATETGTSDVCVLIATKDAPLGLDGLKYVFNFRNLLQRIVTFDIPAFGGADLFTTLPNSVKDFGLRFVEQFDDVTGLAKDGDINNGDGQPQHTINATLQQAEVQNLNAFVNESTTRRLLTNAPSPKDIFDTEEEVIHFVVDGQKTYRFRTEKFSFDGSSQGTTDSAVLTTIDELGRIPINNNLWDATVDKITVHLIDNVGTQVSEKRTFKILQQCMMNMDRVFFLNRLGGWDAFTFTGEKVDAIESRETVMEKILPESFDAEDRSITTLGKTAAERGDVWSKFLTNAEGLWLAELITSPEIRFFDGINLIPIKIKNRNQALVSNKELIQIRLTIQKPELVIQQN